MAKHPVIYFSGCRDWVGHGGEQELHEATGWTHRCYSFHYIGRRESFKRSDFEALKYCKRAKLKLMLDSGAHTFLAGTYDSKNEDVQAYLAEYKAYLRRTKIPWQWYANFDFQKNAPLIFKVYQDLQRDGFTPVPVYHGDRDLSWVRRYHDLGATRLGLGKPVSFKLGGRSLRPFYDRVFEETTKLGMKVHGFAVTGQNLGVYPWESVDSTSWLFAARTGLILKFNQRNKKLQHVHVSTETRERTALPYDSAHNMGSSAYEGLREELRNDGWDIDQLATSGFHRAVYNVKQFLTMTGHRREKQWQSVL